MGSFAHPMQYFAAACENDDIVIAVINFSLKMIIIKINFFKINYIKINLIIINFL